jgi:hypothetical protein
VNRLLTRDPSSGAELVVTRLWCPGSGVTIEGEFSLGWIGRLSPDQLDFVGLLLQARNNLQRLAADLGVSYNTARSRLDEIVAAVGGQPGAEPVTDRPDASSTEGQSVRLRALEAAAAGEITPQEAVRRLRAERERS